jgi:hypothetical protein
VEAITGQLQYLQKGSAEKPLRSQRNGGSCNKKAAEWSPM